jgi:hypothetical protein
VTHMKTKLAGLGCLMFACGATMASLAFAHPPQAVEHAPTAEQCRADRAYWMSKIEQPDVKGTDDVPFVTLLGWDAEMEKCRAVDPPNRWLYFNVGEEALAEMAMRERAFLVRHDMWQQFLDEDAAGKR